MSRHTQIRIRHFRCANGHQFSASCKSVLRRGTDQYEEFYRIDSAWLPVPVCPAADCTLIGQLLSDPADARAFAQVPESERFYAWLSPDGERVSVPGRRGAEMPERYKRAGYRVVEAASLHDFDRLKQIRARQTGNDVWSEFDYDAPTRAAREQAEYTDDLTVDI